MNEIVVTYVEPGDTLSEIAVRYGVTVEELQQWNGIGNPDLVRAGQGILVYTGVDGLDPSASGGMATQSAPETELVVGSGGLWMGGVITLALLLFLLRGLRNASPQAARARIAPRTVGSHRTGPRRYEPKPARVFRPRAAPKVNHGERRVRSALKRRYRDWMLLNDVLLPTGQGTAQIDHILVSPGGVFLIETKDWNGWVFGSPAQHRWTQTFPAGRWSRRVGIKSNRYRIYNPLLQNEGHARAIVNLSIADPWSLRPVAVFVGDAVLKTADNFLAFEKHEKIASRHRTWRMRGVICMSLRELHRYIAFSVQAPSNPGLTPQRMETVCNRITAAAIPVTAKSHARHVEFVRSTKASR